MDTNSLREKAIALYLTGLKICEVNKVLNDLTDERIPYKTVESWIRRYRKKLNSNPAEQITVDEMLSAYETAKNNNEKKERKVALQNYEPHVFEEDFGGAEKIVFGLIGDTQMGSKYTQLTHLNRFYDICAKRGVCNVYHTGDITDGMKMRPGHEYELYTNGLDEMLNDVVTNYPKREGIKTSFITGNHDASIYKHLGYDIGLAIADKRKDLEYLGRDCAIIKLTENCTLELRHPWDGTAYAISYKPQKLVNAMEGGSKPNILAIGHYHKQEYIVYRNVHVFQTACFQSQTPFTRGKGIDVYMGGWIVEVFVDKDGTIRGITPQFIPFYTPIKDDYKKYITKLI